MNLILLTDRELVKHPEFAPHIMLMNMSVKLYAIGKTLFQFWVVNKPGPMFCSGRGKRGESCSHWEGFFVYEFSLQSGSFPPKIGSL